MDLQQKVEADVGQLHHILGTPVVLASGWHHTCHRHTLVAEAADHRPEAAHTQAAVVVGSLHKRVAAEQRIHMAAEPVHRDLGRIRHRRHSILEDE